jgi:hypothetical protein
MQQTVSIAVDYADEILDLCEDCRVDMHGFFCTLQVPTTILLHVLLLTKPHVSICAPSSSASVIIYATELGMS